MAQRADSTGWRGSAQARLLECARAAHLWPVPPGFVAPCGSGWQLFFQEIDMGCQATNLGVEFLLLLQIGGLGVCKRVPSLKEVGKVFERLVAPRTEHVRMDAMFCGQLGERFGFLQQL